jgi:hypothetical protein
VEGVRDGKAENWKRYEIEEMSKFTYNAKTNQENYLNQ